ncbi:MAG: Veg family protein [Clostridia bacterium]|nr:Veg family protein [Clostridia bacterium]
MSSDLAKLKASLDSMIGQEIQLVSRGGHRRAVVRRGTIENTYPSIFIVKLQNNKNPLDNGRRVSYSYTDVLTRVIELSLCKENEA